MGLKEICLQKVILYILCIVLQGGTVLHQSHFMDQEVVALEVVLAYLVNRSKTGDGKF
jgi:hypothetical protein